MRLNQAALVAFVVSVACLMVACSPPAVPPICSPALACATIDYQSSGGSCPNIAEDKGWFKGKNAHPTKSIYVTYRVDGVALNPPPQSPASSFLMQNILPGAANEVTLGCEMVEPVVGSGKYVKYTYTPVAACFDGDPTCAGEAPVAPSNAPSVCLTQTTCNSPDCIDYSFNATGSPAEIAARIAAAKTVNDVLTKPNLNGVDLAGLLATNSFCPKGGSLFVQGSNFQQSGSTCDTVVPARASPPLGLHVHMPSTLGGTYSQVIGTRASFDFPDQFQAVQLEWLDQNGNSLGWEYISHIEVTPGLVKLVGSRHYCIWLHPGNAKSMP